MSPPSKSSRLLLVADPRPASATKPDAPPVRRYRLARLRFEGRSLEADRRFEHLARVFD